MRAAIAVVMSLVTACAIPPLKHSAPEPQREIRYCDGPSILRTQSRGQFPGMCTFPQFANAGPIFPGVDTANELS